MLRRAMIAIRETTERMSAAISIAQVSDSQVFGELEALGTPFGMVMFAVDE